MTDGENNWQIVIPSTGIDWEQFKEGIEYFKRTVDVTYVTSGTAEESEYREGNEFNEGQVLEIHRGSDGYSVEGLNDVYLDRGAMVDAFREKYPQYRAEITDYGKRLELHYWNLSNKKGTSEEQTAFDKYIKNWTKSVKKVVADTAKKLGLDVELIESTEGLKGKKAKANGWFDVKTGKIYVVLPNHKSSHDLVITLMHEGVAHFGLARCIIYR